MKCKLDLDELESTSGPLNPKVSGQNNEDFSKQYLQNVEVLIGAVKHIKYLSV